MYRILLITVLAAVASGAGAASGEDRQAVNDAYREYQEIMARGVSHRAEAVAPAARAYELAKQVYGDHATTAALAINYGNVLQNRGEAAQILEEALRISEAVHGRDGLELVDPLVALGDVRTDLRDPEAARRHYVRALETVREQPEENSFLEGILSLNLGVNNYNDNRRLEAMRLFRRARDIFALHEGEMARVRLATADLWIGTHHMAHGRAEEALQPLQASLAVFSSFPEAQRSAIANYKMLVGAYETLGRSAEATPHVLAVGAITMSEPVLLYEAPAGLRRVREAGTAEVRFTVDAEGYVRDIELLSAAGDDRFGPAALEAAARMRYAPRVEDGRAIPTPAVTHTFNFPRSR